MVRMDSATNKLYISTSDYRIRVPDTTALSKMIEPEQKGYMTDFDKLIMKRWEMHMAEGHFRYGLDVLETRNLYPVGKC